MKKERKSAEKIAFICFLIAAICYFISAAIDIAGKNGSGGGTNICLGCAFLCLALNYRSKDKNKED